MKKIICIALATTMLLTQTASAAPWQWLRNELIYDSEIGFFGNVTLTFASDGGIDSDGDINKIVGTME
jgi:hypothetical protein